MLKKIGAILLISLYTVVVFSFALKQPAENQRNISTPPYKNCKITARHTLKQPAVANVLVIKRECNKESKSLFSKLFLFKIPKLPLDDFFLAAQKALVEKFF